MDFSDQQLIARYLNGDKTSFDLLVRRYLKLAYSVALHYVKNTEDAEDVVQDAFVKAFRHLKSFDREKNFKPWILQIVKNQSLDWLKKKKPSLFASLERDEVLHLIDTLPDPAPLADVIASQKESYGELARAVKGLSAADRRLLFFRYVKGLSFREIGEEMKEVLDTVKSRHRRLLLKLRKNLPDPDRSTS